MAPAEDDTRTVKDFMPPAPAGEEFTAYAGGPLAPGSTVASEDAVVTALRTVYDPEIPVSIYELGLIYKLEVDPQGRVEIDMTLTAPACPVADILPGEVEEKARAVPGVTDVKVELVWDPPWTPDRMSDAARLELGMF